MQEKKCKPCKNLNLHSAFQLSFSSVFQDEYLPSQMLVLTLLTHRHYTRLTKLQASTSSFKLQTIKEEDPQEKLVQFNESSLIFQGYCKLQQHSAQEFYQDNVCSLLLELLFESLLTWFYVCHFSAQVQVKKNLQIYLIFCALPHSSYLYIHSKAFVSHMKGYWKDKTCSKTPHTPASALSAAYNNF